MFDEYKQFAGIIKGDPAITPYLSDTVLDGDPDLVVRPRDIQELREVIDLCNRDKLPLTVCGGQTSMTGASVALSGALMATEKLNRFKGVEECDGRWIATVEPGILLSEFKKSLEEEGFFYPMHPTSVNEAFLGATVATNATGDDTYKYGPTRQWVRRVKASLIDGREIELARKKDLVLKSIKGKAGYFFDGEEIDYFIGSEGTLGVITEVSVEVLKGVPDFFSIMVPFENNELALKFIHKVSTDQLLKPRSLEYIDSVGVEIMKKNEGFPFSDEVVGALVYSNQEYKDLDSVLSKWLAVLESQGLPQDYVDKVLVATSDKEKNDMAAWRHFIPSLINEKYKKYENQGGGKVGGDWWVPQDKILDMMRWFYEISESSGIPFIAYAHLGNGHPHTNYFTRDSREREIALELVKRASKRAVKFGGGVAGEHGIGKIKRYLLPVQWNSRMIDRMKSLKSEYDPNWLLGQGNIF